TDGLCRDSMSGMPYPQQVAVTVGGATLTGCGGDPARLLQGGERAVEDINAAGIIDRSRVSVTFGPDGRVNGRASCNNFMGADRLAGEGPTTEAPAAARKMGAAAQVEQEQRVLHDLRAPHSLDFDETGALVLRSQDGSLK